MSIIDRKHIVVFPAQQQLSELARILRYTQTISYRKDFVMANKFSVGQVQPE